MKKILKNIWEAIVLFFTPIDYEEEIRELEQYRIEAQNRQEEYNKELERIKAL